MATPNYSYEKRQRELAKKRKAEEKAEEKRLRKTQKPGDADGPASSSDSTDASDMHTASEQDPATPQPGLPE